VKPLVLLDCDGILADFVGAALDFVQMKTGERPDRDVIETWDIWDHLDPELEEVFTEYVGRQGFCKSILPYDEALRGFPLLAAVADVHIVTSPFVTAPTWTHERSEWLEQYFGIPHHRVHHTGTKYLTRGDYLVDDHPKHIREWLLNRRDHYLGHALLWDTPHNRREEGLWRVKSWEELVSIVMTSFSISRPKNS
jgi:5'(3')-deoxyribonucleotidase